MGNLLPERVMGVAQSLTAIVLGFAAPAATVPQSGDPAALAAVAASCGGATTAAGDAASRRDAMSCGINVVRRTFGLGSVRGSALLNRSALLKARAVRRCGFSHTPCGMAFRRTFQSAGYTPARALSENLAWGQGSLGSPAQTLASWLRSPQHRANLLGRRWRDVGIAIQQGTMFGRGGVSLWVLQFGRR